LRPAGRQKGERSGRKEGLCLAYFCGLGDAVAKDFELDVTDRGMKGDGHGRRVWPSSLVAHNTLAGNGR